MHLDCLGYTCIHRILPLYHNHPCFVLSRFEYTIEQTAVHRFIALQNSIFFKTQYAYQYFKNVYPIQTHTINNYIKVNAVQTLVE